MEAQKCLVQQNCEVEDIRHQIKRYCRNALCSEILQLYFLHKFATLLPIHALYFISQMVETDSCLKINLSFKTRAFGNTTFNSFPVGKNYLNVNVN